VTGIHSTKQRMIDAGLSMLLKHGYNDLGIQAVLAATNTPKGSFYHHFRDKEDFALQVVDAYVIKVGGDLEAALSSTALAPLARIRRFFELTEAMYRDQGYMGCLLGGLGQELSGISETFRAKVEACFSAIAGRISDCLDEARGRGDIPPETDVRRMADILVNCWEGAALRSRLTRDPGSLGAMLDFYLRSLESRADVSRDLPVARNHFTKR
jgi:TetR/AcrR family transcriptional repressor of nem operon